MTLYSYSRINTFFTCPSQFEHRYIKRTPSPVPEGIELFLGSRFHETMEHLYGLIPERVPTVNELLNFFQKHWQNHLVEAQDTQKRKGFDAPLRIVNEGQSIEDYFQKGQLFVENYYHNYQPFDQDVTEGIEMKVIFNLDPKGQYKMQGYIDRVAREPDGTYVIHDYKTSSRKMSAEDVKFEDQLALYQAGLLQNPKFGPKAKFRQVWHFVAFEKDQVVDERGPEAIAKLQERYIGKIKTIESARSFPTKTSALCGWCEFLSLCPDGQQAVANRKKKKEEGAPGAPPEEQALPAAPVIPALPAETPVPALAAAPALLPKKKGKAVVSQDQLQLF
ncbi:MAG TPA: PD-(D/E)XK nuclease family protein [bacterium]|nr:PD-(D/E)XK nuclease family protein [bacterium]